MPDRDFVQVWKLAEEDEVRQVQVVTGIHAKACLVRQRGGDGIFLERGDGRLGAPLVGACKRLGIELDAVSTDGFRRGRSDP